jgi:hypothetical protein
MSRVLPDALGGGTQRAQRLHQNEVTCGAWPRNYQRKEWRGPPDPEHGDAARASGPGAGYRVARPGPVASL